MHIEYLETVDSIEPAVYNTLLLLFGKQKKNETATFCWSFFILFARREVPCGPATFVGPNSCVLLVGCQGNRD